MDKEQRSEDRVSYNVHFAVQVLSSRDESLVGSMFECDAVDFSPHGMQITSGSPLSSGSRAAITITLSEPAESYRLLGEVRWSRQNDGKAFMGVQLLEEAGFDLAPWVTNFNDLPV